MNINVNNLKRKYYSTNYSKRKLRKINHNEYTRKTYGKSNQADTNYEPPMPVCIEDTEAHLFDFQLIQYLTQIEMPMNEVNRKINYVVRTLHTELNNAHIMYNEIKPFGSSVTGLSFKDSDIDVFIQCQNPSMNVLKRIRNRLNGNPNFRNVVLISSARVPIIKCLHTPTHTECDLSIFSHLGCENTALTKDYMNFDCCLRPMLLFLKHWLKTLNLHGMGKINTYALTWLVIFYMQNRNPKRLPTVQRLQRLTGGRIVSVKSWNCAYTFDGLIDYAKPSMSGIYDLLRNFFIFYSHFDFKNCVMSPFTGTAIPVNLFKNDLLPDNFSRYNELVRSAKAKPFGTDHYIYLQDPFEHNLNIIKQAGETVILKFRHMCRVATGIFQENGGSFLAVNTLLTFKTDIDDNRVDSSSSSTTTNKNKIIVTIKEKHFPNLFKNNEGWKKIFRCLHYVLQKVFLFQLTVFNQYATAESAAPVTVTSSNNEEQSTMMLNVESVADVITGDDGIVNSLNDHADGIWNDLDYGKKIIMNCTTIYDTVSQRQVKKIKRKNLQSPYHIDLEEKRSLQSVIILEQEFRVKIEFVLSVNQKAIYLYVDAPPVFSQYFRANCVNFVGFALHKLYYLDPTALRTKQAATPPHVQVISDEDEHQDDIVPLTNSNHPEHHASYNDALDAVDDV